MSDPPPQIEICFASSFRVSSEKKLPGNSGSNSFSARPLSSVLTREGLKRGSTHCNRSESSERRLPEESLR